jgi:hypothetical protein
MSSVSRFRRSTLTGFASAVVVLATACSAGTCSSTPQSAPISSPSASASASASPSPSPSPSPPIGDACLAGRWVDQRESAPTAWTFNGTVVPVVGLAGFVLTLNQDGTGTADWSNSQPLIGTYQGRQLKIVVRGAWTFHGVVGDGSSFSATGDKGTFTAQFFLGGTRESTFSANVGFGQETYVCTASTLTTSQPNGKGQTTDSYTRG